MSEVDIRTEFENLCRLLSNPSSAKRIDEFTAVLSAILTAGAPEIAVEVFESSPPGVRPDAVAAFRALALELRAQHGIWHGFEEAVERSSGEASYIDDDELRRVVGDFRELSRLRYLYESNVDLAAAEKLADMLASTRGGYVKHAALTVRGLVAVRAGDLELALRCLDEAGSVPADLPLALRGYSRLLYDRLVERGVESPKLAAYRKLLS